jgi:hypothetical protein
MTKLKKLFASSLVVISMTATFAATGHAAPFGGGVPALTNSNGVTNVGWHGRGGGWGWGPGAFIGGIVGGALIASAVAEHRADHVDMDRCARDFPEFSYRTGTYIDRRGVERVCPYLR